MAQQRPKHLPAPQTIEHRTFSSPRATLGGPVSPPVLGLQELIQVGLSQHPRLARAGFDIAAAEGRALQAGLLPNPTVTLNWDELGDRTGPSGINALPNISQEIVTGRKLKLNRAAAHRETDQAHLALADERMQLITEIRRGYFQVLAARRRVEVLQQLLHMAAGALEKADALRKAKQIAELDALQFRLHYNRLATQLQSALQMRIAARRELTATMSAPQLADAEVAGVLDVPLPAYVFAGASRTMLARHPHLQSAQVNVARAELLLRRAEVEKIPNITVSGGYVRQNQNKSDDWSIGFALPVPIFNRNQGNILAARAAVGRAMQNVRQTENELVRRLATAFGNYAAAAQRVRYLQTGVVPAAEQSYRLSLEAFRTGVDDFTYLRILDPQRALIDARLDLIEAQAQAWEAASEIAGLLQEDVWPGAATPPNCDDNHSPAAARSSSPVKR